MKDTTYSFEDFLTNSNNEDARKMPLLLNGKETEHYLMIKGSQAKSIQRAKIKAQAAYSKAEKLKGKEKADAQEIASNEYASSLISDWSFGELKKEMVKTLLTENEGLGFITIAFSSEPENYLAKK